MQLSLGREVEVLAGPVVDQDYRPYTADDLLDPSWVKREPDVGALTLAGPFYRLGTRATGGVVDMRSVPVRRARIDQAQREATRSELENRIIREVGLDGTRDAAFLDANPDWSDFMPRESRTAFLPTGSGRAHASTAL